MSHKREFCAALGGRKFWTCAEAGAVTFFDTTTGQPLASFLLNPSFPATIDLD